MITSSFIDKYVDKVWVADVVSPESAANKAKWGHFDIWHNVNQTCDLVRKFWHVLQKLFLRSFD